MGSQHDNNALKKAEALLNSGDYEAASEIYLSLTKVPAAAHIAYYRLGYIANRTGDPLTAKGLYYKAFELKPDLCKIILPANHVNHNYIFKGLKQEPPIETCPLCGGGGRARWCYLVAELGAAYVQGYNPVRVWMLCDECNHMYAEEFPEQKTVSSIANADIKKDDGKPPPPGMKTNPAVFPYYCEVLNRLRGFTGGGELLEIGIGGGECALTATEMGYNVLGLDISEGNVAQAKKYGIEAEVMDFMQFDTNKKWDIIVMGDVIEHVSDPLPAMGKVRSLLNDGGVLWLSTPNFESAFSIVANHDDAMRRVANHKNYFSRHSMFKLLGMYGFAPVDYKVSSHYNGSMEIIAVKESDTPPSA